MKTAERCSTCQQALETAVVAEDVTRCKRCGQPLTLAAEGLADSGRSWLSEGWSGDHIESTPAQALVNMGLRNDGITQEKGAASYGGEEVDGLPVPA